ncbi:MAG: 2-oxo acid dehydrogenase subunit E2 [Bdellovibrionales bacterium]|nr:2-oxo acid dehydrogenase subunit E2 [Bdellovibrionales bacterium]
MAFIEINKPFEKGQAPSKFRRLAMGSWKAPDDPTIYGVLELNVEKALRHIEVLRSATEEKITITHFLGKMLAEVLKLHPELNCEIRFGKFYRRKGVDISFQVAIEDETADLGLKHRHDLSGAIVRDADQKSIIAIAKELNESARRIRGSRDPGFSGIKRISSFIPGFLQSFAVSVIKGITSGLNLWSPVLGIPKNAFGSLMVTNVGSIGLDFALPALFPPAAVPAIVAVGAIYKAPIYETDAEGVVLKTRLERHIRLCGAFDHRYIDGLHASRIARDMRRFTEHPDQLT